MADDLDLESSAVMREGSNPSFPTKQKSNIITAFSLGNFTSVPAVLVLPSSSGNLITY
jgi:hypothetical protein